MNKSEFLKENYTMEQIYLLSIVSSSLVLDSYVDELDTPVPPAIAIVSDVLGSIRSDLSDEELLEVAAMMAALEDV
jgi:hypothetical protein